jgi:hypothetical protein
MPPKTANVGGANPEWILREFEGMNNLAAREAINDNEFYWCENAIPIAPGKCVPVKAPSAALATVSAETGAPSYVQNFNVLGTDYEFSVWAFSGNGYVVNLSSFAVTKIISGLTSGLTAAAQYSNQGLLIIDPTGYWDWNLTAPNTLTPQNKAIANVTLEGSAAQVAGGTSLRIVTLAPLGTGATFQASYQVVNVTLVNAGSGYAVGDSIFLSDGSPVTPAQIIVASISGGGATGPVTGITLAAGGSYPGPTASTFVATGPTGSTITTTGAGTGATFTDHIQAISMAVLTRGTGYGTDTAVQDQTGSSVVDTWIAASSGVIGGTSIAVYSGRVWIGLSRTVYFTDINSYYSFGGVGGSFFIPDSYLHNNITALYAANNYLYIFGDTSIDALSNVTVSAGVTFFSRINVTASVGTSTPTSIFAYYRAIVFYHASGFYLLAGATPEKISDKVSGLIQNIVAVNPGFSMPLAWGGQVLVQGELCAAMLFSFTDTVTGYGATRGIFALYFRGRWWVYSGLTSGPYQSMVSISVGGVATMYAWAGNSLYRMMDSAAALAAWLLKTKLWDGGAPTHDKQSLNAAVAGVWTGLTPSGVALYIDTETANATTPATLNPLMSVTSGYHFNVSSVNNGGTQYLGLTVTGSTDMSQIDMLALRGSSGPRDKLA